MTWVYIESEPGLYTVGYYGPDGEFAPSSDHDSEREAEQRVCRLNGGEVGVPTPQQGPNVVDFCKGILDALNTMNHNLEGIWEAIRAK
jgi:hypothetical protein